MCWNVFNNQLLCKKVSFCNLLMTFQNNEKAFQKVSVKTIQGLRDDKEICSSVVRLKAFADSLKSLFFCLFISKTSHVLLQITLVRLPFVAIYRKKRKSNSKYFVLLKLELPHPKQFHASLLIFQVTNLNKLHLKDRVCNAITSFNAS